MAGWLGGWLYCVLASGWLKSRLSNILDVLVVLSDEADEVDEEEDDSGCGWPAGWLAGSQTKFPSKRNIGLSVAELKGTSEEHPEDTPAGWRI